MYEKLVLLFTNYAGYNNNAFMFYYKGTKKQTAIEKAKYDFFKCALDSKKDNDGHILKFLNNKFCIDDFFKGDINSYIEPEIITLDEYFEKNRLKMSENYEKMLKRDIKITQLTDNK